MNTISGEEKTEWSKWAEGEKQPESKTLMECLLH